MSDMADYLREQIEYHNMDEFYEERLIVELYTKGMSVSAIGANLNIPVNDVMEILEWAGHFKRKRK